MNKWLAGTLVVFAIGGSVVFYYGYKAKKGMDKISKMMNDMPDKELIKICIKAQSDPATMKNIENMRNATPDSLKMIKKVSPGIYNYNMRMVKLCPRDFKLAPATGTTSPKK